MWWFLRTVFDLGRYSLLDFIFYMVVDGIAKFILKEARSENEKKKIWLMESAVLALICLLIYATDHCPYIMILLTFITAVYSQICQQINFRNLWQRFVEHWEVHVHHADNVKAINEKRKQIEIWRKLSMQAPVSKPVMSRLSDFICRRNQKKSPTAAAPVFSMVNVFRNSPTTVEMPNTINTQPTQSIPSGQPLNQAFPLPMHSFPQPVHVRPQTNMAFSPQSQGFIQANQGVPQPRYISSPLTNQSYSNAQPLQQMPRMTNQLNQTPVKQVNNWFTRNELRRRPLRNYEQRDLQPVSYRSSTPSIKNKFMSVLGYSSVDVNKPAGLRNEGQNLCFMNCVIQCLAHTPNLVDKIISDAEKELDCSQTESIMLDALTDLMSGCKKTKQTGQSTGVLDPASLREAIFAMPNRLVVPTTERQNQQDAAEFFMWLMETVHNALNKKTAKGNRPKGGNLQNLEFIYKDFSEERMQGLKTACREEISQANGLQNETYAEPIQRLSDLEWLSYKQKNHSVIDDTFSGQLVEAYQCLAGNHLTVNTQTFNILPVPIETVNNYSGIVPLQECFTKFCNIEHLFGPEGLECEMCKKNSTGYGSILQNRVKKSGSSRTPVANSHLGSTDSPFHSGVSSSTMMSPIPGQIDTLNDSGFQDNVFRTSTPVGETGRFAFPSRRVKEIERRCLLRQLPDCLVIQPLRFSYNQFSQQSRKIHTPISVPLKDLDLTNIVYDNVTNREDLTAGHSEQKYDLYAVCSHLGAESTNYGHYVCYCLAQNGVWYKFDDELVTEVNMEYEITSKEIRQNAYMLFYKRASQVPT